MSVLVYTENWDGKFKKLTFELISYANEIASKLNMDVTALSIGDVSDDELQKLGKYGAKKILSVKDAKLKNLENNVYTSIISKAATTINASVVILSNNNTGKAIAPRLSVKLKAGLASGVVDLPSSYEPFIIKKKIFSGKAFANVCIKTPVKVFTLFQNSFEIKVSETNAVIENIAMDANEADFKTTIIDVNKQTNKLLLTDADIVVSGGRGMRGPENWWAIEELAKLLDAATACSRPVSDEGWRTHEEHTGQTGKVIAPNLYIACGISGAIQHIAGISSTKCIVAINKDPEAPIFEVADYGIVGDVMTVLPELISAVKEFKNSI